MWIYTGSLPTQTSLFSVKFALFLKNASRFVYFTTFFGRKLQIHCLGQFDSYMIISVLARKCQNCKVVTLPNNAWFNRKKCLSVYLSWFPNDRKSFLTQTNYCIILLSQDRIQDLCPLHLQVRVVSLQSEFPLTIESFSCTWTFVAFWKKIVKFLVENTTTT